jgi:hypothetical protein
MQEVPRKGLNLASASCIREPALSLFYRPAFGGRRCARDRTSHALHELSTVTSYLVARNSRCRS